MIFYFADRKMNILGQASTSLPKGVIISNDRKTEEVDEGVAILEFDLEYDPEWRKKAEAWTEAGNYILRKDGDDREFYTIISREKDPVNGSVNDIYAEDAGLDLLNEVVGAYKADKAYSAEFYIKKFSYDSGFEVGVNEVSNLTRKLSWDGEATATERLLSVATQFDNAEISFSFDVDRMSVVHKYINIFKRRGVDSGVQLQIGREIKKIRIKDTIEDLATAYVCTGGIPDGKDDPITLAGYKYDDGDFYVEGTHLNSRKALQKWSRYQIKTEMGDNVGHIVKTFSYDTTSQSELCNRAVSSLKKICDVNTTYEIELSYLPRGTKIGDTVYIIDHTGELYLSSRLLKIETSVCDNTKTAELGEYSVKSSGVSEKLRELADAFAKVAQNRKFYTWIAYADDDIGTGASLDSYGKEYLEIASNRVTRDPDLTDPTVYTWIKIRGEQGMPGTSGKDGKTSYFHVKYSDVEKPASYSDMTETPAKYIGTYVDYELEDSKDPSKYTWSKFQGEDGTDGIPGKNGENGETSYVHFAYATSEDGKTSFSTTDPTDKTYIGQYVDFKKVDSEQPEKYRWSKFQGPKGPAGSDGEQGYGIVASVTRENFTEDQWNSTYGMTGHLTSWTGTSTLRNGCRIGDIFVVVGTATDTKNAHTAYYRSDTDAGDLQGICIGHTIAFRGSAGIDGTDGKGIESIKEHYAVSTSNTVTPTSWLDDVPVTNPVNKYLWNYETITYTNGTSVDSKKRVIGVYGDTGKDGAKGEDGDDFRWNLVKGSSMTNGTRLVSDGTNGMNNVNTNVYENDGFHIITPSSGNNNNGIGFVYNDFSILGIKPGDTLTFSCDVKGTSDTNKPFIRLHFQASGTTWCDSGHLESSDGQFTPTADFKRVSVTYTLPDKDIYKSKRMWLAIHGNYASDLYIRNIKLELGSPATPWSPHPDDLVGADGKGIKSTVVTYQASTSGTVIPTGTWQTSIPTVSAGQYLWTRTVITYTDDSKSTSYSVGRMGINGTNGSAGRGIKSTAITYQAGSSGTTAPTGTWQTTVPATSASSPYLWTRTIITYTDDTTSISYAVGSTLEGVSVGGRNLARKTSNEYCTAFNSFNGGDNICLNLATVSTTGLTVGDKVTVRLVYKYTNIVAVTGKTAAAWLQGAGAGNITEWKSGTFVSNQRIALSGSGEKVIKYSFAITSDMIKNQCWYVNIRHDGIQSGSVQWKEFKVEKGNIATDWTPAPEDGIASVDVEYYLSTSATALSGGSWSTTAPTWVNGKYMWSRTVTTDGAGNKTYSPNQNGVCIAGAKGETGATGATGVAGKGVSSIVEQYYKSTSATALSGGSWGTTYPGWESGKYIWTRSVITYTDKTTTTTTAVCVTGTKGETGATGAPGKDANQVVHSVDGNGNTNQYIEFATVKVIRNYANYATTFKISGREYETTDVQFSFVSVNSTDPGLNFLRATGGFNVWIYKKTTSTWGLVTKLNGAWGRMRVYNFRPDNESISLTWTDTRHASLPSGCIAADQLQAAKTATNFMEFNSGTGLQIGDKTNGSWKGFRSRITSTAFEILNEAGSAVASYGRKLIQLGKDTTDAVIELCGGKGKISFKNNTSSSSWGYAKDADDLTISSEGICLDGQEVSILASNDKIINNVVDDKLTQAYIKVRTSLTEDQSSSSSSILMNTLAYYGQIYDLFMMGGGRITLSSQKRDSSDKAQTLTITPDAININGKSFLDRTYPVGSIYMSVNNTNPKDLFGGTWVAWGAGRVPVGFSGGDGNFNSSEKTGGSKTINIQHNHGLSNARAAVGRADSSTSTISYTAGGNPHNVYFDREFSYWGGIAGVSKHATDTAKIYGNTDNGGSTAASVLQPYITCYMWKRTA
ncbi:MAG: phage tail spike protein [Lachnospiraceae bacterium]|nr:phage tail spike protein [Lachnospiraceae bacterium]